jgi:nucleoside-diphosphate-sugar epimerase
LSKGTSNNEQRTTFKLWGDNSLITSLTDWRPEYTIEAGLKETIDWFLKGENLKKYKAGIYNL